MDMYIYIKNNISVSILIQLNALNTKIFVCYICLVQYICINELLLVKICTDAHIYMCFLLFLNEKNGGEARSFVPSVDYYSYIWDFKVI